MDWNSIVPGCLVEFPVLNEKGETVRVDFIPTLGCVPAVFERVVFWAITFAGITAVFFIIWAGVKYITSRGDPKQVEGARKTLTFAIVGLVLVLMSFLIVYLISDITGVDCIERFGFDSCGTTPTSTPPA